MATLTKRRLNRFGRKHRRAVAAMRAVILPLQEECSTLRASNARLTLAVANLEDRICRLQNMTLWDFLKSHVFRKEVTSA